MNLKEFEKGRISAAHKERYWVKTPDGDFEGEVIGNLRFSASSRADFPVVGDWVAISAWDDDKVLIHGIHPRQSLLERQAVGKSTEKQLIAANVDVAMIVQAVDRDFNLNRIERYLSICHVAQVEPWIVLNKIDLITGDELERIIAAVNDRIDVPVLSISNASKQGINQLKDRMTSGHTYCLLGSSGVGKSTLTNLLTGLDLMKTDQISSHTGKGRHITSHRELFVLDNGAELIDNPGMREVGIADDSGGLEMAFSVIQELAKGCKYSDCSHVDEHGCAVIEALNTGDLNEAAYNNFQKMERERDHYASTIAERRQKDKNFGKVVKHYKNVKKHNRDTFNP